MKIWLQTRKTVSYNTWSIRSIRMSWTNVLQNLPLKSSSPAFDSVCASLESLKKEMEEVKAELREERLKRKKVEAKARKLKQRLKDDRVIDNQ